MSKTSASNYDSAATNTNRISMKANLIPALVLIVIGTLFLLNNLGLTNLSLGKLISTWWPAILVLVGISLLFKDRSGK
ncbi:hypothetical protein SAMN06296416_106175 [Pseudoxanthomonas wuyuanensis]|uniref:LiaI-LiaF-like transmembrane region domain-containing protein n=2 Tax=Pseudoxanthomonas wuyuanensis TaxID=1073196 RepID=A0A286D985_9GAMM|nr:hypothetical protein SAMN06296416_106175 [Pseudoxanthomonas wuyuanensis]